MVSANNRFSRPTISCRGAASRPIGRSLTAVPYFWMDFACCRQLGVTRSATLALLFGASFKALLVISNLPYRPLDAAVDPMVVNRRLGRTFAHWRSEIISR